MKKERWGVILRFATVGYLVYGIPVAHYFSRDSRAPKCMPAEGGKPGPFCRAKGAQRCIACAELVRAEGEEEARRLVSEYLAANPLSMASLWPAVLGVEPTCTLAEAKRAFRAKVKTAHPDNGGTAEAFQRVREAYAAAERQLGGVS